MELNPDFSDLLREFSAAEVRYLIVGAWAVGYYARPRATADLDVWVEPSIENARLVLRALAAFGAPLENLTETDLLSDDLIYQIGIAPVRIDVITGIDGVVFKDAWTAREEARIEDIAVHFIGRDDLIVNKRQTGRAKDLADLELLGEST
ncbi:MAG TPA: hypothetical protein VIG32_02045 [Candidatus Baltobacteraceae bacterium]|jgi:hypothetical protein